MLKKVLKNNSRALRRLNRMYKIYGVFLWAKWGIMELHWSGKIDGDGYPLVYIYYDGNGAADEWHLVPIHQASSGYYYDWFTSKSSAQTVQKELNNRLEEEYNYATSSR